ncbi:hypothetical protein [Micromonospora carbonacea]|uniref:hypothetical protein n=1 Tax=Micromonospora carbonacea TaxID=47853 RepID=UPI0033FE6667
MTTTQTASPTAATLWRCTKCGKWSHAKRRPSSHKRWVQTGTETVTEMESWDTGALVEVEVPTGEVQKCGPFRAWSAAPLETTPSRPHRDEPALDRRVVNVHLPAHDIA